MHELNFREMTKQQLAEESLIQLTYALLEEKKVSIPFNDLIDNLKEITGISNAQIKKQLLQYYTDLNVDGRFLFNQENGWGLREWFKVEQIEEETAPSVKTHKKKAKAAADDDDLDLEEDEIGFDEDYEEFVEDEEDDKDDADDALEFDDAEVIDEELVEDEEFELDDEDEEEDDEEEEL